MYKIFDKYLFCRVLSVFIEIWLLLNFIVMLLDVVGKGLPSFNGGSDVVRFFAFYFLFSDGLMGPAMPFFYTLSALITLLIIDNANELVALRTMGISSARIVSPLLAGVVVASLFMNGVREFVVPGQVAYLPLSRNDYVRRPTEFEVERALDSLGCFYILGEKINLAEGRMSKPQITPSEEVNSLGNKITADYADYFEADGDRPAGWLLDNVTVPESFLDDYSQKESKGEKIVFQPLFDENGNFKKQIFVSTHITPVHLVAGAKWFSYGKLNELHAAVYDPTFKKNKVDLIISVHNRVGRVVTDLIPFFLGIPIYMNRRMGEKTFQKLFTSIGLPALYVLAQFAFSSVGRNLGVPDVAVCGPLIFVPVAAVLFWSMLRKQI